MNKIYSLLTRRIQKIYAQFHRKTADLAILKCGCHGIGEILTSIHKTF